MMKILFISTQNMLQYQQLWELYGNYTNTQYHYQEYYIQKKMLKIKSLKKKLHFPHRGWMQNCESYKWKHTIPPTGITYKRTHSEKKKCSIFHREVGLTSASGLLLDCMERIQSNMVLFSSAWNKYSEPLKVLRRNTFFFLV